VAAACWRPFAHHFRLSFEYVDSVARKSHHVHVFAVGADGYRRGRAQRLRVSAIESCVGQASLTTALLGQRRRRPRPVEYVDRPRHQRDGVDSGSLGRDRNAFSTPQRPTPSAADSLCVGYAAGSSARLRQQPGGRGAREDRDAVAEQGRHVDAAIVWADRHCVGTVELSAERAAHDLAVDETAAVVGRLRQRTGRGVASEYVERARARSRGVYVLAVASHRDALDRGHGARRRAPIRASLRNAAVGAGGLGKRAA
jgi:hypothetical protein